MPHTAPDFATLKTRQRAEREAWPQDFALRIHRSISWIGRAEKESEDPGAAFLFYWIAFNAAYGGERSTSGARRDFGAFFEKIVRLDTGNRLYGMVWSAFPGSIRLFLENRFVFAPFWAFQHGDPEAIDWEVRFDAARRRFNQAFRDGETGIILSMLFDRLYVLRNQIMHGGSTWNSGTNRDQLRDGSAILMSVVPVMADLMMNEPDGDWGVPMYPVVEG